MRKAWLAACEEAGEREVTSGVVSQVVRKLIAAGATRRTVKKSPVKTKPTRVYMEIKHIKTILVQLAKIREATKGTKGAGKTADAIEKIEALLPGI